MVPSTWIEEDVVIRNEWTPEERMCVTKYVWIFVLKLKVFQIIYLQKAHRPITGHPFEHTTSNAGIHYSADIHEEKYLLYGQKMSAGTGIDFQTIGLKQQSISFSFSVT